MIRGGWNRSVVTVVTVGNAQCPQWQGRRQMELGAMVSHPSQTVVSDPGSSVSQRVQAVNWMEDWQDDWYWHDSEDCASEWYDNESAYLVCGVAGSSPSLNQQSEVKVKLMIDSGSQSTACSVDFAKGYATDNTERANLWDIQDQKIEAHGNKIVDVKFHGQANETPVPASIKVDVSDVARNVASMCRLLRAGFDLHFTNHGHTCRMENGGLKTTIGEDSLSSEAPLYGLDVQMLPPPGEICESRSTASARIAPIAMGRTSRRRQQSGIGWTCAGCWSEREKRHLHGSCSRWRKMADCVAGRQKSQREDVKHQTSR